MFKCVFVKKKYDSAEFPSYNLARGFVESVGEDCMIYTPKGIEIAAYVKRSWLIFH